MEHKLEKYKQPYSKYYNYPSCDSKDWMFRYWGDNYSRLLTIKVTNSRYILIKTSVPLPGLLGP